MENSGTVTTGISFNTDLLHEADKIANDLIMSRSKFVQIAVRNQIKLHRKQDMRQFLDSLNNEEMITLKKLIEQHP